MIPLDVMSSGFDVVSNGRIVVIFSEGLKALGFPIMKLQFRNNPELCTEGVAGIVMIDCFAKWPVPSWFDSSVGRSLRGVF